MRSLPMLLQVSVEVPKNTCVLGIAGYIITGRNYIRTRAISQSI